MSNISSITRNIVELLANKKYSIEYYQREYRWGEEQIVELLTDLEDKFFEVFKYKKYKISIEIIFFIIACIGVIGINSPKQPQFSSFP